MENMKRLSEMTLQGLSHTEHLINQRYEYNLSNVRSELRTLIDKYDYKMTLDLSWENTLSEYSKAHADYHTKFELLMSHVSALTSAHKAHLETFKYAKQLLKQEISDNTEELD